MPKEPLDQPVMHRIGDNVRRLRGDRTQAELAADARCSTPTISKIETGQYSSLDVQMVVRLALALGCNLDALLDGCDMAMDIVRYRQAAA